MNRDDELLQAYLDGDLAEDDVASLEDRLVAEASLAARLDAIADVRMRLAGADDIDVPDGLAQRLTERLVAERSGVVSLASARDSARRRRSPYAALGAVAAAVIALAVVGGGVLRGVTSSGGGQALDSADQMALEDAAAPAQGGGDDSASSGADVGATEAAGAPDMESQTSAVQSGAGGAEGADASLPEVVHSGVALADAAAVRQRYAGEAHDPRDLSAENERATRRRTQEAVRCLEQQGLLAAVTYIESVTFDEQAAYVYVIRTDAQRRAIVVTADGCETLAAVDL